MANEERKALKISKELHRRLKRRAVDNGETMTALAERLLRAGLVSESKRLAGKGKPKAPDKGG
jgi:plasmid stability protein